MKILGCCWSAERGTKGPETRAITVAGLGSRREISDVLFWDELLLGVDVEHFFRQGLVDRGDEAEMLIEPLRLLPCRVIIQVLIEYFLKVVQKLKDDVNDICDLSQTTL